MGLFGGNYARPGKGISKEEAAKRNYFDILGRKFWKILQVNLLYFFVNILFFGAFAFMILPLFMATDEASVDNLLNSIILPIVRGEMLIPIAYFIPFVFIGPATCGLTYVVRNYAKQEHAFLFSDFFEHLKKNFKQGLAASAVLTTVCYLFITAFIFYLNQVAFKPIVIAVGIIFGIILVSASFYIYPIMVTFDMKFKHIIKNSFIFALAKLPQNTFILIIVGGVNVLLAFYQPLIWMILFVFILIGWSAYTINYYTWHVIDKYMISQIEKTDDGLEESVFEDDLITK